MADTSLVSRVKLQLELGVIIAKNSKKTTSAIWRMFAERRIFAELGKTNVPTIEDEPNIDGSMEVGMF